MFILYISLPRPAKAVARALFLQLQLVGTALKTAQRGLRRVAFHSPQIAGNTSMVVGYMVKMAYNFLCILGVGRKMSSATLQRGGFSVRQR